MMCVTLLIVLLAATDVAASWEYSVACPPLLILTDPSSSSCELVLLPADDYPATVTITTASTSEVLVVDEETRWDADGHQLSGGVENKGIMISSDIQIYVYLVHEDIYGDLEATAFEPITANRNEFFVLNNKITSTTCVSDLTTQYFSVAAAVNGTVVTITAPSGTSDAFDLDMHDTYSQVASSGLIDYSEYKISASSPVSVQSGILCVISGGSAGTYITEHRPVERYAVEYVVPSVRASVPRGYDVHVVASSDDTSVDIDGDIIVLNEGESIVETFIGRTTTTRVACSRPCNVVQFTLGLNNVHGIFAMSVIPPNEYYTRAVFTTSISIYTFYISVIVDSPTIVTDILLDGVAFSPSWATDGNYTYAEAVITQGYHVMNSTDSRFAVYSYAHIGTDVFGYGFAVPPRGSDETSTTSATTPSVPTVTPTPTGPGSTLPQYAITTNSTVVTVDASDVKPLCVLDYNDQMDSQAKTMAANIDGLIGSVLCPNQEIGEVLITSVFSSLQFSGNQGTAYVVYSMDVNMDVNLLDIEECAIDVGQYVSDGDNWPHPILPGSTDCPPMELIPPRFDATASQWICPQTDDVDIDAELLADNILLYQVEVGDVMDTEDGTDLSPSCTTDYAQELARQALAMALTIDGMMDRGEMCDSNQTLTELSPSSALAAIGAQAYYTVTLLTQPGPAVSFGEFLGCANEVFTYMRTVSNWPDPILPPPAGCPALVSDTTMLVDRGSGWVCVDKP